MFRQEVRRAGQARRSSQRTSRTTFSKMTAAVVLVPPCYQVRPEAACLRTNDGSPHAEFRAQLVSRSRCCSEPGAGGQLGRLTHLHHTYMYCTTVACRLVDRCKWQTREHTGGTATFLDRCSFPLLFVLNFLGIGTSKVEVPKYGKSIDFVCSGWSDLFVV